jgi:hypothetical protein
MSRKKINAQITITASYNDSISITISDKDSSTAFLQMVLTREQFINATMNRLAQTEVGSAFIENIERVGKHLELDTLVIEIPKYGDRELASKIARGKCPYGWVPDIYFQNQDSFFTGEDRKHYARTMIRRWVEKEKQDV